MKVFISHPINEEKLAVELKTILESSDKIEIAYIAQKEKNFEIEISEKIIKQINDSDYLVAIITNDAKTSASVNQELGFSQGIELKKIPLIEKSAKKGFLIYGKDSIDFTRNDFSEKCTEALEYILNHPLDNTKKSSEKINEYSIPGTGTTSRFLRGIPPMRSANRKIIIIPSSRFVSKSFSNDTISFIKNGPDMFTKESSKLKQNEVHLIGANNGREYIRYGIINEQGQIALQEKLHYDKVVEVGRELTYLLLTLVFAKEFYNKIGYTGSLSIRYIHQGVENFKFGPGPDMHDRIMDEYTVQKSEVEIQRSIDSNFDVKQLANSIMVEFGRACDWTPPDELFLPYLNLIATHYFPART